MHGVTSHDLLGWLVNQEAGRSKTIALGQDDGAVGEDGEALDFVADGIDEFWNGQVAAAVLGDNGGMVGVVVGEGVVGHVFLVVVEFPGVNKATGSKDKGGVVVDLDGISDFDWFSGGWKQCWEFIEASSVVGKVEEARRILQPAGVSVEGLAAACERMELDGAGVRVNLVDAAGASVCHIAGGEEALFFLMPGESLWNKAVLQAGVAGYGGAAGKGVGIGELSVGQKGYPCQKEEQDQNQDDFADDFDG